MSSEFRLTDSAETSRRLEPAWPYDHAHRGQEPGTAARAEARGSLRSQRRRAGNARRPLLIATVAILGVLLAAAPARAADVRKQIDEIIKPLIARKTHVGVVVGVVNKDGKQVIGYGRVKLGSDRAPDGDTIFEIGSITKVFTTLLLADMVQDGTVGLRDPVQSCLPDGVTVPKRGDREITLFDLATHTSGLPRLAKHKPKDPENPYADYTVEQLHEFLSNHELRRDVGKYEYSNLGMGLLGHALANKVKMTYEQLVVRRVCDPLGMKDTRITLSADQRTRLAPGYKQRRLLGLLPRKRASNWDVPTLAGAGALRSSTNEMLVFLSANLGLTKTRLLPAMQTCHTARYPTDGGGGHVGFGWHILKLADTEEEIICHNGGTGGYCSYMGFARKSGWGVIVLTNTAKSVDAEAVAIIKVLNRKSE